MNLSTPGLRGGRRVRLLHTSDIHVGDESDPSGRLDALRRVIDTCLSVSPDILLVAGDLFDNNRVSSTNIADCLDELARTRVPTCIVNGNHDALETPSIYDRVRLETAGSHVSFLNDSNGSTVVLEELSVAVWARAMLAHTPSNSPLDGYERSSNTLWHVAMAHGHFFRGHHDEGRSSPIYASQIEALQCDYLALGHWHQWADVSSGATTAHYSGSPSDPFNLHPTANLITLEAGRTPSVQRINIL